MDKSNQIDLNSDFENIKEQKKEDTLLESLLFLSKYHKRTASAESLVAGLAIYNSLMTPSMFEKSAKRIGLITKAVSRKIPEIDNLALPAVLILNNNKACVLLNIDLEKNQASLIMPHLSSDSQINLTIEELEKLYTGNLFIIKPAYNFENRVDKEVEINDTKRWFWRTMQKNLSIYKLVVIAAILINIFVIFVPLFTMNVYDRVLPNKAVDTLWVLLLGIVFVLIFDFILKLIRAYFIEQAGKRADIRMSSKIFDQLLNIKLDAKPSSTGMFVSRLQSFESG